MLSGHRSILNILWSRLFSVSPVNRVFQHPKFPSQDHNEKSSILDVSVLRYFLLIGIKNHDNDTPPLFCQSRSKYFYLTIARGVLELLPKTRARVSRNWLPTLMINIQTSLSDLSPIIGYACH